jgi:hypothetical protein
MAPFGYGIEFLRLNYEALESYSQCTTAQEVMILHNQYEAFVKDKVAQKELRQETQAASTSNVVTSSYIDDSDLPPQQEEEVDGIEEEELKEGGESRLSKLDQSSSNGNSTTDSSMLQKKMSELSTDDK